MAGVGEREQEALSGRCSFLSVAHAPIGRVHTTDGGRRMAMARGPRQAGCPLQWPGSVDVSHAPPETNAARAARSPRLPAARNALFNSALLISRYSAWEVTRTPQDTQRATSVSHCVQTCRTMPVHHGATGCVL